MGAVARVSQVRVRRFASLVLALVLAGLGLSLGPRGADTPASAPGRDSSAPERIVGRASVIDGDTIRIGGESIRINGVDAPESRQSCRDGAGAPYACGRNAAQALDTFLAQSRPTTCAFVARDRYRRIVGQCFRADGADVGAWLVRNGHAVEWTNYSAGRYSADEAAARRRKAGVWRGSFENPWDWRAAQRTKS